jgi:hypothetical protein
MALLHELAINRIIKNREGVKVGGLNKFCRTLAKKHNFDFFYGLKRIPDAWSYEPYETEDLPGTISLYEVEDGHPISAAKMRDYTDFWFYCDCDYLDVRLFVFDRYGQNEREISLTEYWYDFLIRDYGPGGKLHGTMTKPAANDNEPPRESKTVA